MKLAVIAAVISFGLTASGIAIASGNHGSAAPATATADARVAIPVEGLTCASCSLTIRRALKKMDGVKNVEPGAQGNQALITYDASKVKPEQLVEAINKLGFKAGTPVKG